MVVESSIEKDDGLYFPHSSKNPGGPLNGTDMGLENSHQYRASSLYGRWRTESVDSYTAFNNDPINNVDPTGLDATATQPGSSGSAPNWSISIPSAPGDNTTLSQAQIYAQEATNRAMYHHNMAIKTYNPMFVHQFPDQVPANDLKQITEDNTASSYWEEVAQKFQDRATELLSVIGEVKNFLRNFPDAKYGPPDSGTSISSPGYVDIGIQYDPQQQGGKPVWWTMERPWLSAGGDVMKAALFGNGGTRSTTMVPDNPEEPYEKQIWESNRMPGNKNKWEPKETTFQGRANAAGDAVGTAAPMIAKGLEAAILDITSVKIRGWSLNGSSGLIMIEANGDALTPVQATKVLEGWMGISSEVVEKLFTK